MQEVELCMGRLFIRNLYAINLLNQLQSTALTWLAILTLRLGKASPFARAAQKLARHLRKGASFQSLL